MLLIVLALTTTACSEWRAASDPEEPAAPPATDQAADSDAAGTDAGDETPEEAPDSADAVRRDLLPRRR